MLILINLTGLRKTYWIPKFELHKEKKNWIWGVKFLFIDFNIFSQTAGLAAIDILNGKRRGASDVLLPNESDKTSTNPDMGCKVQVYITNSMRRQLCDLNFTKSQIDKLTPEQAAEHIKNNTGPS